MTLHRWIPTAYHITHSLSQWVIVAWPITISVTWQTALVLWLSDNDSC